MILGMTLCRSRMHCKYEKLSSFLVATNRNKSKLNSKLQALRTLSLALSVAIPNLLTLLYNMCMGSAFKHLVSQATSSVLPLPPLPLIFTFDNTYLNFHVTDFIRLIIPIEVFHLQHHNPRCSNLKAGL
jgi:hypothetical protein